MGQEVNVLEQWYDEEKKCLMIRAKAPDGNVLEAAMPAGVVNLNGDMFTEECFRKMARDDTWGKPLWVEAYKRVHIKKTLGKLYKMLLDGEKLNSEATNMFNEAIEYLYDKPTLVNDGG